MAKLNDTSKGILGEASKKIGNYTESTGGGTPLKKGEKLVDHPEAKRVMQPRDEDGQFTYNSVNGKELKYGPSRGTTVPPFLRGIKLTYCAPGTKLKVEGEDGIKIKIMTIDMSVEEIVNACKEYIESEGGFAGMGEGSSITKKGRKSKEEKEAKAGQIGSVDPKSLSAGTQKEMTEAANRYAAENSATEVNPTVGGYKVLTDLLTETGDAKRVTPARYWKRNKGDMPTAVSSSRPTPTSSSSSDTVTAPTGGTTKPSIGSTMGLSEEETKKIDGISEAETPAEAKEEDVSFTAEDAKDGKAFYEKHKEHIKSMVSEFNKKHPDKKISPATIIQLVRNGKLKSLSAWKKAMSK